MTTPSLKLVTDHCRRVRDDSIAAQARVETDLRGALRTLQTLEQYRDEQHQRARDSRGDSGGSPLSASLLLLQTRFSDKLEEAITLQTLRVTELRQHIENCRAQVLALQQRLKAIETIESARQERLRSRAARAEQSATDERAANQHAHRARNVAETVAGKPHHHCPR